tara:strand:- start:910 stop:1200 length:291 start_codon:yes stop_codon:yes gene_type:complete
MDFSKYLVEYIGTTFFLYVIIATGNWLLIGAALAVAALIGGPISGGMFNPAVTGMMIMADKMKGADVLPYVVAQCLGAITAFQLNKIMPLPKYLKF